MRTSVVCCVLLGSGLLCLPGSLAAGGVSLPQESCPAGDETAPVVVEVFSDFQCPACADLYRESLRNVLTDYVAAGRVCVLFHEFPLERHEHARVAARYAVAARRVSPGTGVRVIDALYTRQERWSQDGEVARALGDVLAVEEMRDLSLRLEDPEVEEEIRRDIEAGKERGVRYTPTVFLHHGGTIRRIPSTVQWGILSRYLDYLVTQPPEGSR